jgi:hypothetical protein
MMVKSLFSLGLAPILDWFWGAADHAVAAEVASVSAPSALAALGVDLLEGVVLADPAAAAQQVVGDACEEHAAQVAPHAVTQKTLTHLISN